MADRDPRDRRAALMGQHALNGIDFVEVVDAAQTRLRVHFLLPVPDAATLRAHVTRATITGGDTIPDVAVRTIEPTDWDEDTAHRPTLDLAVDAPGDFSIYVLALEQDTTKVLDRCFDHIDFSFKAGCPSTLDCESPPHLCPPGETTAPPIDYLAKDFDSFKRALLEYSTQRYPAWQERSEADFGVMFAEALSSVADDLSYQQDRIAAEGWLETATERRSLVRLARLVDYEPGVRTAARTLLQFQMTLPGQIPAGVVVTALAPDGDTVDFETGANLADATLHDADPAWNGLEPWWFDDADRCLPRGATAMWIKRPARDVVAGQQLVIETARASPADPPVRQLVTIGPPVHDVDPLYSQPVTMITWATADALRVEHGLTRTKVRGNLVPAVHGRRQVEHFVIADTRSLVPGPVPALIRTGANGSPQFLYSLADAPLAWLAQDQPDEAPHPEIDLIETSRGDRDRWSWRRLMFRTKPFDKVFTIDPARYRKLDVQGWFAEYDGDDGETVRFGDGSLGAIPELGMTFEVTYRVGGGLAGNVAAGALTRMDAMVRAALGVETVSNPFAASGGRDEEPAARVRELAPQRFRAKPMRAVRTDDYEAAATSLDWVQRAGTRFRYTGSWLTVFTSVDPKHTEVLEDQRALELTRLLDRRRLAGYESFALPPRFASLDLDIAICVRPDAFRSDVHGALLDALDTNTHLDGTRGFFHPDELTFGMPLERSKLEAVIQEVRGVDGVVDVRYRRRGHTPGFVRMPDAIEFAADEIVRVDNDPDRPERGSLRLELRGGK